jgi:hypothetical protein
MRHPLISVAIATVLSCAATAQALTCHIVLDRNDNVIYRDAVPPVDLSDRGKDERAAMRQRGEFLLMMEADQCPTFVATSNASGAAGASVDEIVAGLRNYSGGGGSMSTGRARGSAAAPVVSAAPAATSSSRRAY